MTHKVRIAERNYPKTTTKTSTPARFAYSLRRPDSGEVILTRGDGEWRLAQAMDLEEEYSCIILTHETFHRIMARFGVDQKPNKLLHLGDVCALVGF